MRKSKIVCCVAPVFCSFIQSINSLLSSPQCLIQLFVVILWSCFVHLARRLNSSSLFIKCYRCFFYIILNLKKIVIILSIFQRKIAYFNKTFIGKFTQQKKHSNSRKWKTKHPLRLIISFARAFIALFEENPLPNNLTLYLSLFFK